MSSQAAPALEPKSAPPKRAPEVTQAYRKAHKNYVLVSGLLASWELIGISLNTKDKWGVELKSPTAVPLILFTLVLYSGYKMTIEWLQCDKRRRSYQAARVDYVVAHFIGISALGVSVFQYLAKTQLVDILQRYIGKYRGGFILGALVMFTGLQFSTIILKAWRQGLKYVRKRDLFRLILLLASVAILLSILWSSLSKYEKLLLPYLVAISILAAAVVRWVMSKAMRENEQA